FLCTVRVAETGANLGEIGQRDVAFGVHWKIELRGCQLIEYPLCFLLESKIACDQDQTRAPSRGFRIFFGDKLPNQRSNLGEAPLLAASGEHLHAIDAGCGLALKLVRDLERSFSQALGRREIAVQDRPHRTCAGYYIPVTAGKFVQHLLSTLEVRLEVGQIAD